MADIRRASRQRLREMAYDVPREDPTDEPLNRGLYQHLEVAEARRELRRRGEKL